MPSSLVNGITIPLYVVQNISLVFTTWYLATLYNFIAKRTLEKTWITILLVLITCLIIFNTVAICYSNAVLFVEYYGETTRLWTISFFLKTCITINCVTVFLIQSAYTVFIVQLWPQIGPRWLKFIVVPGIVAAILAAVGISVRLNVIIGSGHSYLDAKIIRKLQNILDLSTATAVLSMATDIAISVAMARLLFLSRNRTGKGFHFLKKMSLFIGACGAATCIVSALVIIITHNVSDYSFWRLVLLPVPGLIGAISFLSLLNNRTSWDTQSCVSDRTPGSNLVTMVNVNNSDKSQSIRIKDEKLDQV